MQSRGNWVLFITNVMLILNAHVALKCSTDIKRVLLRGPCNCIAESSFDPILLEKGCVSKNKSNILRETGFRSLMACRIFGSNL